MEGRFVGRDIIEKPSCPFCGLLIERPRELETLTPNEMPVGSCSCGAAYTCDVTGHNLGTAMMEALVFACKGDWDHAWNLLPEEDYFESEVKNYDLETHLVVHCGIYRGRRIAGTLYFIRLQGDIPQVTDEGTRKRLEKTTPVSQGSSAKRRGRKPFSKGEVEVLVKEYELGTLLNMAEQDKRIIRDLQRLLYSVDKLIRWRAADILGKVSALIARRDQVAISKLLQRLFTAVSDTAASSWGAIDAIGEIISHSPEQFAGYLPQLYQFTGDRALLTEVLRALGKISEKRPDLIRKQAFYFIPLLRDPAHEIRGYATILLGNLGANEARDDLTNLTEDFTGIEVYRGGTMDKQTLAQLASEALEKL
jgi:HEAT repeat protein